MVLGIILATYNLENYGPADRRTEAGFQPEYPKPESEKAALRRVIAALHAEILAVQEIGSTGHLDELQRDLRSEGVDYPYSVMAEAEDHRRHTALLSRRPFKAVRRQVENVKRGLLEAEIGTPQGDIALFVVHLKSHVTEQPNDPGGALRRVAEAAAVRDCIVREFPDPERARFVILGDCNDGSRSRALVRLERKGARAVAWRLPAADGRGEVWTEFWSGGDLYSQLDHILVSLALRPHVVSGRAHIYDGPGVAEASDHRPVWAEIDVR